MKTINIGEIPLSRLILGHLPFLGESYQGPLRNHEYLTRFSDITNTVKIITTALQSNVTAMAVTSSTSRHGILLRKAMREAVAKTCLSLSILPCFSIPLAINGVPIDDYRRWVTYYQYEQQFSPTSLVDTYLSDPILLCRPGWETNFRHALRTSSAYTPDEIERIDINYATLHHTLTFYQDFPIPFVEAGSESDFLIMTGRLDLLHDFIQFLKKTFDSPVFLGIHHAGTSIPLLEQTNIGVDGYLTPINKIGALMLPTQTQAVQAIASTHKPVIAIKPLAGGRITPVDAFEYVFKTNHATAAMIGVATVNELQVDLTAAEFFLQ